MITVNSISGGKTSSFLAANYPADYNVFSLVCLNDVACRPKDPSLIQYVNAKLEKYTPQYGEFIATAEDDQTLVVMRDLEQYLGREITWVRGDNYDDVIDGGTQAFLPSWARRYCTEKTKLLPIFLWWFFNIGEAVNMRIGFRADEFMRMERFFNNSNPTEFTIPVSCALKGKKRMQHETFKWRYCSMPLVKDGIDNLDVKNYWRGKTVGGSLFDPVRDIVFPEISNCVFCFHKLKHILAHEWQINPEKMQWAANQEKKGMGTWMDDKTTYEDIKVLADSQFGFGGGKNQQLTMCDVGGCTD